MFKEEDYVMYEEEYIVSISADANVLEKKKDAQKNK
jgi:hypothetical protein